MNDTPTIQADISPGELIDKITILEIKAARICDAGKLGNVQRELAVLTRARDGAVRPSADLDALTGQLKAVNEAIWQIEDDIRDCERNQDFGPKFIELARGVYRNNDRRAELKREINHLLGSRLVEEKSYAEY